MTQNIAPLPDLTLTPGMTVVLWGIDSAGGAFVAGIVILDISIYGDSPDIDDGAGTGEFVLPVFPYGTNV
jgi:hypothetical protein